MGAICFEVIIKINTNATREMGKKRKNAEDHLIKNCVKFISFFKISINRNDFLRLIKIVIVVVYVSFKLFLFLSSSYFNQQFCHINCKLIQMVTTKKDYTCIHQTTFFSLYYEFPLKFANLNYISIITHFFPKTNKSSIWRFATQFVRSINNVRIYDYKQSSTTMSIIHA